MALCNTLYRVEKIVWNAVNVSKMKMMMICKTNKQTNKPRHDYTLRDKLIPFMIIINAIIHLKVQHSPYECAKGK